MTSLAARERIHRKGVPVAASKRPSFLKRQKEQARLARATEKREARRARKHSKTTAAAAMDDSGLTDADLAETQDDQIAGDDEGDQGPA